MFTYTNTTTGTSQYILSGQWFFLFPKKLFRDFNGFFKLD